MKKVLIVDDDEGNVKYLSTVLTENGYVAVAAAEGVEGMAVAKTEKPDLILLDVMMPKRSGFILFKQLKKEDALKDIPVIMLTGVAEAIAETEGEGDGAISEIKDSFVPKLKDKVKEFRSDGEVRPEVFLDKPIEPDTLLKHVRELIGAA